MLNRKYQLIDKISEGGTSSVYRARKTGNDTVLAIKILHSTSPRVEEIIRFHQEIDILSGLRHPHIVNIQERGIADDSVFFQGPKHYLVMDYIEGGNLNDFLAAGSLGLDQALGIIKQIGQALGELHGNGIVHGDLKPENIMISRSNGMPHATLIDFALSRMKPAQWQAHTTGTFFYIPPEQTGMIKRPVDQRSDLYAVGVIGYRMLTGHLPFQGRTLMELLHHQAAVRPEKPSAQNPSVPAILDDMIMKLLEKEPSLRYQSAEGLVFDLDQLQQGARHFSLGEGDPPPEPDFLPDIRGRETELGYLSGMIESPDHAGHMVCLLAGEAGIGKTKILEAVSHGAREKGLAVLEGRCVERKNQTPWSLFQDILSDYMKVFGQYPDRQKESISRAVKKESGDLGSIIIRLYPPASVLLGSCPELPSLDLEKDQLRSFHAILRFILALVRAEKRMVIILEDLQWVDSRSLALLEDLIRTPSEDRLVIFGSFRANEVDEAHPLGSLIHSFAGRNNLEVLPIHPLTRQDAGAMIKAILGKEPEEFSSLAEFIYEKCHGNPLYLLEVINSLFQKRILYRQGKRLCFDKNSLDQIQIPQNLQDTILHRISRLNDRDISILRDAAIMGRQFSIDLLLALEQSNGISRKEVVACLDRALAHRIIMKDSGSPQGCFLFAHDRIQEAFCRNIGDLKKTIHNDIGHLMESTFNRSEEASNTLFDLAHHFIEGANEPKILQYGYPAGLAALNRYDYPLAVRYLTIVKDLLEKKPDREEDPESREQWYQCGKKLGEAMIMTGDIKAGIDLLASLVFFPADILEKANLYFQMCSAYSTQSEWKHCESYCKAGLALLGETLPTRERQVKWAIAGTILRHLFQIILPKSLLREKDPGAIAATRLMIRFYNTIGMCMILQNKYKFLYASLRSRLFSEIRLGDTDALSESYGQFAALCIVKGFRRTATRYLEKAMALAIQSSNHLLYAHLCMYKGFYHQFKADFHAAFNPFYKGIEVFDRIGDIGSSLRCRYGLIDNYLFMSDHENVEQLLAPYAQLSQKFNDDTGIAASMYRHACMIFEKGELEKAENEALECIAFSEKHRTLHNLCWSHALLAAIYLEKDQTDKALPLVQKGMAMHWQKAILGQYAVWNFNLYAQALIKIRAAGSKVPMRQIRRACKIAIKESKHWRAYYGVSLRIYAMYLQLANRNRLAEKTFLKSMDLLKTQPRAFELALTHREFGYFLRQTGRNQAALEQFNRAWALFKEMDSRFTTRIADFPGPCDLPPASGQHMATITNLRAAFKPTHRLAACTDLKQTAHYVLETSMTITGAEGGCLFLVDRETGRLGMIAKHHVAGTDLIDYSQSIVDRVHQHGLPVCSIDAAGDIQLNTYQSVARKHLKSVLCMPLFYENHVSGACYLCNQLSSGVFSKEEENLLGDFLSTAAIHIENAKLKQTLEKIKDAPSTKRPSVHEDDIQTVLEYLRSNYTSEINRDTVALALNKDPVRLGKHFTAVMGKSLKVYINELRLNHAYKLLLETDKKIIDIAFESGFESLRTFNRIFSDAMGDTPSTYRKHYRSGMKSPIRRQKG